MKLIIEIPEEQYNDIVKYLTNNDGNYAYSDFNLREIIRNGTPYNPSGDLISREALKESIEKYRPKSTVKSLFLDGLNCMFMNCISEIDNAQAVERPQGDCISRSEAEKLGATCLARRNENGQLEAIISLDNAPKAPIPNEQIAWEQGFEAGLAQGKKDRPQGEWIDRMLDKGYVECPFCHKQITGGDLNFCVKCGADMRKGGAE